MQANVRTIFIPQNVRGWLLVQMPISVRLDGVLKKMGFRLLGDLHGISYDRFKEVKNCGRHTVAELKKFINRLHSGEFEHAALRPELLSLTILWIS